MPHGPFFFFFFSAHSATPFSYEALPNNIHKLILNEIHDENGPASRPTLYSVSCVNQRLNNLAMPFLMDSRVSMVEVAFPSDSSEKKAHSLLQLNGWIFEHADQMPTMACVDALMHIEKAMDGLTMQELGKYVDHFKMPLPAPSNPSLSVNQMIVMQKATNFYCKASGNLSTHYRQLSASFEEILSSPSRPSISASTPFMQRENE